MQSIQGWKYIEFLTGTGIFGLSPKTLTNFYRCTIESILSGCITAWYGNCTALNRKALQGWCGLHNASLWANNLPSKTPTAPDVTGRSKRSSRTLNTINSINNSIIALNTTTHDILIWLSNNPLKNTPVGYWGTFVHSQNNSSLQTVQCESAIWWMKRDICYKTPKHVL